MRKQKKGILSLLIEDMRTGLITRRMLLRQAARMGLTGSALALLEACGSTPPSNPSTELTWWSERDEIGTYKALVDLYNSTNNKGIRVSYPNEQGLDTNVLHDQLIQELQNNRPSPDIISMDIIWTNEFASKGWVMALNDFWPAEERHNYLDLPIQFSTYKEKIYAAPFHTDIGLMYYRTDLVDFSLNPSGSMPQEWTWDDLEYMVRHTKQNGSDLPPYGYLWQATYQQSTTSPRPYYEGLTCNWLEVLSSYGGKIVDNPHNPKHVTLSSNQAAAETLRRMRSWLSQGNISPFNFNARPYDESSTATIWGNGDAIFLRNWPTYIAESSKDSHPKVQGRFGITNLPGSHERRYGLSCIGGWGLAINAFSSTEKHEAAWDFINWMLQEDQQTFAAIDTSFTMTHVNVYKNKDLNRQNPFYPKIRGIIDHCSQARPQLSNYQQFSSVMQEKIYQILTDPAPNPNIDEALKVLQDELQNIIDKGRL